MFQLFMQKLLNWGKSGTHKPWKESPSPGELPLTRRIRENTGNVKPDYKPQFSSNDSQQVIMAPTLALKELHFGQQPEEGCKEVKLINEQNPEQTVTIDLGEYSEVTLNRNNIDPDNPTLCPNNHVALYFRYGKWFVKPSSNAYRSCILPLQPRYISNGQTIILGNRQIVIYLENTQPDHLPGFFSEVNTITLHDLQSNRFIRLQHAENVVNRSLIDYNDTSLSAKTHARIFRSGKRWLIQNTSPRFSTFVKITGEEELQNGTRLLLGNRLYIFTSSTDVPGTDVPGTDVPGMDVPGTDVPGH